MESKGAGTHVELCAPALGAGKGCERHAPSFADGFQALQTQPGLAISRRVPGDLTVLSPFWEKPAFLRRARLELSSAHLHTLTHTAQKMERK